MELSLDLSLAFVPRTVSEIFNIKVKKEGSQKMEDFLKRLEDEMRKIEGFKRVLPLCTILVNDAITRLKEEIKEGMRKHDEAVVEELKPFMKTDYGGNWSLTKGKENGDNKKNWMNSLQLWKAETKPRSEEDDRSVPENLIQATNKCVSQRMMMRDDKEVSKVPNLSLMTPTFESNHRSGSPLITKSVEVKVQSQPQQNPRKQRRCWSPELHRRFVDALQQLGGPQVAGPKQIRELMQVEGLTNDEVKSHLQKYRLHVRRPQVSSVGKANNSGLCMMAQDQCGDNNKSKGNMSQSGSPQGPLFLGGSGRNSMDTEEDEQSDCHNWKAGLHQQPEADVL